MVPLVLIHPVCGANSHAVSGGHFLILRHDAPVGKSKAGWPFLRTYLHASGYRAADRMCEISGGNLRDVLSDRFRGGRSASPLAPAACITDSAATGLALRSSAYPIRIPVAGREPGVPPDAPKGAT